MLKYFSDERRTARLNRRTIKLLQRAARKGVHPRTTVVR